MFADGRMHVDRYAHVNGRSDRSLRVRDLMRHLWKLGLLAAPPKEEIPDDLWANVYSLGKPKEFNMRLVENSRRSQGANVL